MKNYDQMARGFKMWPQPTCLILSLGQATTLPERLAGIQNDARVLDFDSYDEGCIVDILMREVVQRKFSTQVPRDRLLKYLQLAILRLGWCLAVSFVAGHDENRNGTTKWRTEENRRRAHK